MPHGRDRVLKSGPAPDRGYALHPLHRPGREEVVIEAINGADFYVQKGGDPKAQFTVLAHMIRQ